jgi:hypothetical protein
MLSMLSGSKSYLIMVATWISIILAVYNGTMDLDTAITAIIAATSIGTLRSAIGTSK